MSSLTGLAFQIDFLVGRGSRRNAVSTIRDTVDQINLVAREGASAAAKERKKNLEKDLGELDQLSKDASQELVKSKEATAKALAKRTARTAAAVTRRIKTDTSGIEKVGKKTVSVAKMMKSSFKDLNAALESRGVTGIAGKSLTNEKAMIDLVGRERGEREQILSIQREINDSKRAAGKITEGDIRNERALKNVIDELNALEKQEGMTQADIQKKKNQLIREFNEQTNDEIRDTKRLIQLRQEQAAAVERVATSVGTTLRNAFVYSTAAVTAFYYKMNEVNQTFAQFENELINAQSIFQTTQDTLFGLSDEIANFGLNYGVELQNASTGLYQLASAGLSAEDSLAVLNDTLTLSMAVQGDHNTISKLTTQTLFGFGMEMSQSGELVDKFAHAINKSLIEYQDLASAVKFAMPFFVSTGQSVDQLLGSLQVLTNRALEAGIAGRGLRQAMAEFAEGAEDSTREFAKLGVQVVDSQGNMLQLTEIARNFANAFPDINDNVELMTTLLDDLNVRGATAFVHLVQNVDEFEAAVGDLQNAHGSAAEMAEIQQASITNQMQILKNALMAPFLITDEIGRANGFMNEFHMTLHRVVAQFSGLIYETLPDGEKRLTDVGKGMKTFVIDAMKQLAGLLTEGMILFKAFAKEAGSSTEILNMLTMPLRVVLNLLQLIGPEGIKFILIWKVLNGVLPVTSMLMAVLTNATVIDTIVTKINALAKEEQAAAMRAVGIAGIAAMAGVGALLLINIKFAKTAPTMAKVLSAIAGGIAAVGIAAFITGGSIASLGTALPALIVAGAAMGVAFSALMTKMMQGPDMESMIGDIPEYNIGAPTDVPVADTGMRVRAYDTGGRPNHRMVMVEPGETIVSKTQNMAGGNAALGGGSGITIAVHGDVYDADKFASKIAQVLPNALRNVNDAGGI
jgi:TP901 family phage tail tape measure protein